MFKKFNLVGFLFLFVFSFGAFSQSDEEVISQFIKKQKEISDKSKIQSLYQEFKVSMMGMEMPNRLWVKGENTRVETDFMGQTVVVVVTPNAGWQIQNGVVTDIPQEQLEGVKKQILNQTLAANINFADEEFSQSNNNYEILGREKIDNVSCYRLKITPKDTSEGTNELFVWFEPKTYLIRKVSFKQSQMGQEQDINIFVKEYQQVAGFTFPKLVDMTIGKDQDVKLEFTSIKVNEPVDDSLFKK